MQSIETVVLDKYVQGICKNRSMTPAERANHAATAMRVHVAQENGLMLNADLPVEMEAVEDIADHLIERQSIMLDNVYSASVDAFVELDEWYDQPRSIPGLVRLVKEVQEMDS